MSFPALWLLVPLVPLVALLATVLYRASRR